MAAALRDVVARLDRLNIRYMVTGSVAMSVYITPRLTMDIDVVIEFSARDAQRFADEFAGDYYVNAASVRRAIERQSMFNIINLPLGIKIDCIPRKPDEFSIARFDRRVMMIMDDVSFWCITKEDLILAKLMWARESHSELQFRDISNLADSGYDLEYVSYWSERIDLNEVWTALDEWKIQAGK
jgi:hypothetical protein